MKKKILLAAAAISFFNIQLSAQNTNPVVMEIGGRQIHQQEFMKDFRQSVGDNLVSRNASEEEKPSGIE